MHRRHFIKLAAAAAGSLVLPGCATYAPVPALRFAAMDEPPFFGLARSLREEHDYIAEVEGRLPPQLCGTLFRNGPGLFERGGFVKRALLDGDGMVQSFDFAQGSVRYRNRFVRTRKFVREEAAGRFLYPTWSTQAPGGWLANLFPEERVENQAGITAILSNGRLYAFDESALPYELDPQTLETRGISTLGLPPGFTIYAAHSKIDPLNGDWIHFGIRYGRDPQIHITIFRADGSLRRHRIIPLPRFVYIHDFFVTRRRIVLSLHPAMIDLFRFLAGFRSLAKSLRWRPEEGNLLLVIEREGEEPPLFLETEASFMWHAVNAFDDGEGIVADFVGYRNPDHFIGRDPTIFAVMEGREGEHRFPGELVRYRIDPTRKRLERELLHPGSFEWPRINDCRRCLGYRYAYLLAARPGDFFWSFLERRDMRSGASVRFDFGPGRYCTEPVFVPLAGKEYDPARQEEPGFVLSEVYDAAERKSFLAVFDAERIADGPLARVLLSHHVPFSFHGFWNAGG